MKRRRRGTERQSKPTRRGMLLLLVLVVIAFLSLGAYAFTDLMIAQHDASIQYGRQISCRSLVETGASIVQLLLSKTKEERTGAGGTFDNPDLLGGVNVIEDADPAFRGYVSIVAPNIDSNGNLAGVRHGLEDESTRLNLNTLLAVEKIMPGAAKTFLMALPGMTDDIADAILDWLDPDEDVREYGCEIEYYSGLTQPYAPKNGPLETVEELLLVRGVTPQLLFGADVNRNGQLDPHESGDNTAAADVDPTAFRGWSAYLTLHSLEWNVAPDGNPRIFINNNDLTALHDQLAAVFSQEWVNFIILYRQVGPSAPPTTQMTLSNASSGGLEIALALAVQTTSSTNTTVNAGAIALDLALPAKTPLAQVLDLVGATVQYTPAGATQAVTIQSPFGADLGSMNAYMAELMDNVTVNPAATIPGRININQAPATILNGIPGITPEIVEKILSSRDVEATNDARRHETWLMQEGIVTAAEMKVMMPFVTCGGDVYRAQVVGYFQGAAASSRAEIIFDATTPLPRILFWRDLSHLGRGYAIETLGVDFTE